MAVEKKLECMYYMKPMVDLKVNIELPTCMYKMKPFHETRTTPITEGTETKMADEPDTESQLRLSLALEKLEDIKSEVLNLQKSVKQESLKSEIPSSSQNVKFKPQEVVIRANPENPPYSVWAFLYLLKDGLKAQLVTYSHSSLKSLPEEVNHLSGTRNDGKFDLTLTVIWKNTGKDPEMIVDPFRQTIIEAEVNIARYLSRVLSSGYDSDPYEALQIDYWLEIAHSMIIHGTSKDRNAALKLLNSHLAKNSHLLGYALSLADVFMWSALLQCKMHKDLPAHTSKWWKVITEIPMFHGVEPK